MLHVEHIVLGCLEAHGEFRFVLADARALHAFGDPVARLFEAFDTLLQVSRYWCLSLPGQLELIAFELCVAFFKLVEADVHFFQ